MNNTRAVAVSGVCSAMATVCFVGSAYLELFGFLLTLLGAMLVCVPMMITPRYKVYTIIVATVSVTVTLLLAWGMVVNIVYFTATMLPLVIVKVWCDNITLDEQACKQKHTKTKWVLYYIFMQIAIVLSLVVTRLFMDLQWSVIFDSTIVYLMIILLELVPVALDRVLGSALNIVKSAMVKAKLLP